MVAKCTRELLGTFILVLTVGLNGLNKSSAGAYSIAVSLMWLIYSLGIVSGAHFPSDSLVLYICAADWLMCWQGRLINSLVRGPFGIGRNGCPWLPACKWAPLLQLMIRLAVAALT